MRRKSILLCQLLKNGGHTHLEGTCHGEGAVFLDCLERRKILDISHLFFDLICQDTSKCKYKM